MTQVPEYQGGTPGGAESMVKGPAIGLMVVGGIGIALQALGIVLNLLGVAVGGAQGGQQGMANMMQGTVGLVFGVVGIIIGAVILLGAMKMMKLQSYGFAMTASIIAMIPCISPCCLLGLPIGIWALVILLKPEVKSAFTG